jgi:hypothetical protein
MSEEASQFFRICDDFENEGVLAQKYKVYSFKSNVFEKS